MQAESSGFGNRSFYIAFGIFLASFALKIFYFMALNNLEPYRGDSFYYFQYAINLNEHNVFSKDRGDFPVPDSYWAPGYPFFLFLCLKISDFFQIYFYPCVMLSQAMLGGIIAALTFLTGRFFLPVSYSIVGALLTTFSPHLMTLGGEILSEVLLTAFLLAGVYLYILCLNRKQSFVWALLSGIVLGFAYLINPVILLAPILFLVRFFFVCRVPNLGVPSLKVIGVSAIIFSVIVFAWLLRDLVNVPKNQLASSDRAFENLVIGSHSNFHQMWRNNPRDPTNPADLDMKKYKGDHIGFYRELTSRVSSEPFHYLNWYFIQKPLDLWGWNIFVGRGGIFVSAPNSTLYDKSAVASVSLVIMKSTHYWFFGLALIGLIFAIKESASLKKESVLVLYICLISVSAVYVALHADARYSIPMRPEFYLCSVYAIYKLISLTKALSNKSTLSLDANS